MALLVSAVINLARDYHPALSPANAPEQIAFRATQRFQNELMEEIYVRQNGFFAQRLTIAFDAATFTAGIDLTTEIPAGVKQILNPTNFIRNTSDPVTYDPGLFVPFEQIDQSGGLAISQDYQNYSGLVLTYVPVPEEITDGADELTGFPDDARDAFATMLAAFWLRRLVGNPSYNVDRRDADYWDAYAASEKDRFLKRVFVGQTQSQSFYIKDLAGSGSTGGPGGGPSFTIRNNTLWLLRGGCAGPVYLW